jgi:hypothetical protein
VDIICLVEKAKSTDTIFLFSKEWAVSNIWVSGFMPIFYDSSFEYNTHKGYRASASAKRLRTHLFYQ